MKPLLKFRLNGKPLDLRQSRPVVHRMAVLLEKLPDMEVFDGRGIAERLHSTYETVRHYNSEPELQPFCVRIKGKTIWGNRKSIEMLKKHLEAS